MSSAPIPERMMAVLWMGYGGYEQLSFREDVPVPRPAPGEVLVRIGAAGVNNTDINTRIGWYSRGGAADSGWTGAQHQFPRIQGADACGRIVAVGAGVSAGRVGERILVEPIIRPSGRHGERVIYFGSECDGAFAEYACVPSVNAHAIHSSLSDAELASFPCAYAAAEHMLQRSRVGAAEDVLITGASGGVGSAAVQLALRRGARVIAMAGPSKAAAIGALGAARVIDRGADLVAVLGEASIEVVIDVVGGAPFPQLLNVLKPRGRYVTAGAIAGPLVELDLRTLYLKDLELQGCTVFEPVVFRNLIGYIERGEIRPLVAKHYPLREIVAAQQDFTTKNHVGKVVLLP